MKGFKFRKEKELVKEELKAEAASASVAPVATQPPVEAPRPPSHFETTIRGVANVYSPEVFGVSGVVQADLLASILEELRLIRELLLAVVEAENAPAASSDAEQQGGSLGEALGKMNAPAKE
jgi:hypothetical protein